MRLNCNCWLEKLLRRKLRHPRPSSLGMSQLSPGIITYWNKGLRRRHLNTLNAQLEPSSTIDAAFDEIIASMSNSAQDHINLADALTSQTIEILKILEKKNDELKKKACPRALSINLILTEYFNRRCNSFRSCSRIGTAHIQSASRSGELNSSCDFVLSAWRACRVNKRSDGDHKAHYKADLGIFLSFCSMMKVVQRLNHFGRSRCDYPSCAYR